MVTLRSQGGKIIIQDGKVGASQQCCCDGGCCCTAIGINNELTQEECEQCDISFFCEETMTMPEPDQPCPEGWFGVGYCTRLTPVASCDECAEGQGCSYSTNGTCGIWIPQENCETESFDYESVCGDSLPSQLCVTIYDTTITLNQIGFPPANIYYSYGTPTSSINISRLGCGLWSFQYESVTNCIREQDSFTFSGKCLPLSDTIPINALGCPGSNGVEMVAVTVTAGSCA